VSTAVVYASAPLNHEPSLQGQALQQIC